MAKLSENQLAVLHMACTHGHLTQGCAAQSDYGGRESTLLSLRRRGLLDRMNKPTAAGLAVHDALGDATADTRLTGSSMP